MITRRHAEETAKYLGVSLDDLSYAALTSAYRARARQAHPDAPGGNADAWRRLKRAHDLLGEWLRQNRHVEGECKECGGTGRTKTKPVRWCPACRGKGVTNVGV